MNFLRALWNLPEIYKEYQNISRLLAALERVEQMLTATSLPPLPDLSLLDTNKIEQSYANTEKNLIADKAIGLLESRRSAISMGSAVGSSEVRKKNSALFGIEQEIGRLQAQKESRLNSSFVVE